MKTTISLHVNPKYSYNFQNSGSSNYFPECSESVPRAARDQGGGPVGGTGHPAATSAGALLLFSALAPDVDFSLSVKTVVLINK